MPSYNSIGGKWTPSSEIAHGIYNKTGKTLEHEWIIGPDGTHKVEPGDQFTYNGPDREAVKALAEADEEFFGGDFRRDPEFRKATKTMGFETIDEYLDYIDYDHDKEIKAAKEAKKSHINKHNLPKRAKEIKIMSGGKSTAGDFIGGFGDERLRESSELKEDDVDKPVKSNK